MLARKLVSPTMMVLFVSAGFTAPVVAPAAAQTTLQKLDKISLQWRERFRSSNVGWCTGYTVSWSQYGTSGDEAAKIDELKAIGQDLEKEYPTDPRARGFNHDNNHLKLLAFAEIVEAQTETPSPRGPYILGNCGEISSSLYAFLFKYYKGLELATARQPGGDHAFVLVKMPNGDIYIADGWQGTATGPLVLGEGGYLVDARTGQPPSGYNYAMQITSGQTGGGSATWHTSTGSNVF